MKLVSTTTAASSILVARAMLFAWLPPCRVVHSFTSQQQQQQHYQSKRRIQSQQQQQQRLFASVAPSSSSSAAAKDATQQQQQQQQDAVAAVGTIVTQYDHGALLAVQIQDDKDSATRDLIGHQVVLVVDDDNDNQQQQQQRGLVVAHRPPLVFCFMMPPDNHEDIDKINTATTTTTIPPKGKVQILMALAKVSATVTCATVDACGRAIDKTQHDKDAAQQQQQQQCDGRAIFSPIPQVKDIALINAPVLTGITAVDALAPIGRGQNMLWITPTALVVPTRQYLVDWIHQLVTTTTTTTTTPVIYAALDTDEATLAQLPSTRVQVVRRRKSGGSTTTSSNDPVVRAAEGVAMAGTACALAEQWALQQQGQHAVVIIDTLDAHKILWDATTRVLVDIFGVDAVVQSDRSGGASSEMRAFYSSLIQRSAQYKANRGGGSVTLLLVSTIPSLIPDDNFDETTTTTTTTTKEDVFTPQDFATSPAKVRERLDVLVQKKIPLTAANLRKIQIPIPTNAEGKRRLVLQHAEELISMSDGQIWLDEQAVLPNKENSGSAATAQQWPPVDPQRSVTRIGIGADTPSRADAPALRKVVEGLRLVLSQAKDNLVGVSKSSTVATKKQILRQKGLLLVLHQEPGSGARRLSESCALMLAASQGLLDALVEDEAVSAGSDQGVALVKGVLQNLHETIPAVMKEIDDSLDLSDENKATMLDALNAHLAK